MLRVYGHPWSINTRKTLMILAEKQYRAQLVLVMIPKGEQRAPEHVARHPFGKVPVLEDDGFVLYETRAINHYLERRLPGPSLLPPEAAASARCEQWIGIADSYFIPHAHPLIVEALFRRYLGGDQNTTLMAASRAAMQPALDVLDQQLANHAFVAGDTFSLADIHWMPYMEYLGRVGEAAAVSERPHLRDWWARVASRPSWQSVARSGPQPDEPGMTADTIERLYRR